MLTWTSLRARRSTAASACGLVIATVLALACGESEDGVALARAQYEEGRLEETLETLRGVLRSRPRDVEANLLFGRALLQSGQPSLAVWPLSVAMESDRVAEAGVLLAAALLATGNAEEALRAADAVLSSEPEEKVALELRARANLAANRPEPALADADRLLELAPDLLSALGVRALALYQLGRLEEAVEALERLERSEGAGADLGARICVALASSHEERGQPGAAESALRGCLQRFPGDPIVARVTADFFDRAGRSAEATRVLRESIEGLPQALAVLELVASRLRASGEGGEAERLVNEAIEHAPSAEAWASLASFRRRGGDLRGARSALERALELAAGNEALRFEYADLLVDLDELDRAETVAKDLSEPAYAHLIRGRVRFERGDPRGALEALEAGLVLWPGNGGARFLAGRAAEAMGNLPRAKIEYREAARSGARDTQAELGLARVHALLGEHDLALEFALAYTRSHPEEADGYLLAARAATAAADYGAARRALTKLRGLAVGEGIVVAELASVARAAEGPAAAAGLVERSGLDLDAPENEIALRSLIEDLLAQRKHAEALRRLDPILARHPERASLLEARGLALLRSGAPAEEARSAFDRALELEPGRPAALAGLAGIGAGAGDLAGAIMLLDEAAAAEPGQPNHAYQAAQLARELNRFEAEPRLRALVARHPQHAGACNDLAWLLAETRKELDLALELAERSARLDASPAAQDTLGFVRLRRGEYGEAATALMRAVEAAPERPGSRYRLGLALAGSGDREAAVREIRRALGAGPFPEAGAARAELARLTQGG